MRKFYSGTVYKCSLWKEVSFVAYISMRKNLPGEVGGGFFFRAGSGNAVNNGLIRCVCPE